MYINHTQICIRTCLRTRDRVHGTLFHLLYNCMVLLEGLLSSKDHWSVQNQSLGLV